MRVLGLDYGTKTVGVAISDEMGITAQPIMTIERKSENKLRKTLAKIEEIIEEYKVSFVVLGYPKNMNNTIDPGRWRRKNSKNILSEEPVLMWFYRMKDCLRWSRNEY